MFASFCLLPNKPVNENTTQKLSFSPSKTNMYIYKNTFQIQRNVSPKHTIAWRTIEFSPELKQIHGNTFQGNVSWKKQTIFWNTTYKHREIARSKLRFVQFDQQGVIECLSPFIHSGSFFKYFLAPKVLAFQFRVKIGLICLWNSYVWAGKYIGLWKLGTFSFNSMDKLLCVPFLVPDVNLGIRMRSKYINCGQNIF